MLNYKSIASIVTLAIILTIISISAFASTENQQGYSEACAVQTLHTIVDTL